jgi:hypothetical protein
MAFKQDDAFILFCIFYFILFISRRFSCYMQVWWNEDLSSVTHFILPLSSYHVILFLFYSAAAAAFPVHIYLFYCKMFFMILFFILFILTPDD